MREKFWARAYRRSWLFSQWVYSRWSKAILARESANG